MSGSALLGMGGGAASGAMAGSLLAPGIGTAIGAGLGGALGLLGGMGSDDYANAQSQIAMAQLQMQQQSRDLAMSIAGPSTNELMLQQQNLDQLGQYNMYQQDQLQKATQMLDAIHPGIMESSRQIANLMSGGSNPLLEPTQRQISGGRDQLQSNITEQMGYGGGLTTAGMSAMSNYNMNADQQLNQARFGLMQGYGQMGSTLLSQQNSLMGGINNNAALSSSMRGQALSTENQFKARQIGAVEATPMTPYAGAQYTGQALMGQYQMGVSSGLMNSAGNLGGMAMMMKSMKPQTTT